jgi:predicted GNAT family acetyltransferase
MRFGMKTTLSPQTYRRTWPCRNVTKHDVALLGALMLEAYRGTIDYEGETLEEAQAQAQREIDGTSCPLLHDCSFVCEIDGMARGAIMISRWHDVPLVTDIMVHPGMKNQGLGAFLLQKSMNALLELGETELSLYVTDGNTNAQHVYAKLGFEVVQSYD